MALGHPKSKGPAKGVKYQASPRGAAVVSEAQCITRRATVSR
eukprot:CAMPEP_0170409914 /NCGR_PEP_ID=MMETSP0117_2-20130122/29599_1 /TAXON_ID=400756 /ORGANISM="Durinskia baltica, Strain CSIRO CS-38" /LENGTH=41 /DNA_ID= /DNA_START= /DNA_END= /DNA_ORIENTATION=